MSIKVKCTSPTQIHWLQWSTKQNRNLIIHYHRPLNLPKIHLRQIIQKRTIINIYLAAVLHSCSNHVHSHRISNQSRISKKGLPSSSNHNFLQLRNKKQIKMILAKIISPHQHKCLRLI
jgi:hypothetical protein